MTIEHIRATRTPMQSFPQNNTKLSQKGYLMKVPADYITQVPASDLFVSVRLSETDHIKLFLTVSCLIKSVQHSNYGFHPNGYLQLKNTTYHAFVLYFSALK